VANLSNFTFSFQILIISIVCLFFYVSEVMIYLIFSAPGRVLLLLVELFPGPRFLSSDVATTLAKSILDEVGRTSIDFKGNKIFFICGGLLS
jgi:hypothetical protein